jgi:DNA-binding transcriptional ArsR family regulator
VSTARSKKAKAADRPGPAPEQLDVAVDLFGLLADTTRLAVLWALAYGDYDVSSLAQMAGSSKTSTSQHLAKLRLAGVVSARKEGRRVIYRIENSHIRQLVLEGLLHADHRVSGLPPHR